MDRAGGITRLLAYAVIGDTPAGPDRLRAHLARHLPAAMRAQARAQPIYETLEGWQESTRGARRWADLPATAVKYVRRIEELVEAPVALLSTSPERDDTITVTDPFAG